MIKNFKALLLGGLFLAAVSCSKKDDVTPSTPAGTPETPAADAAQLPATTAKATVIVSSAAVSADVAAVASTKSVSALSSAQSLVGGIAGGLGGFRMAPSKSAAIRLISALNLSSLAKIKRKGARLDPPADSLQGTYTYSFAGDSVVYVKGTTNQIVILFPDSLNHVNNTGVNNCQLTLSNFEMTSFTGIDQSLPTLVNLSLTIDGKKEMGIDYSASFDANGDPTALTAVILVNPFQLTEKLSSSATVGSSSLLFENIETGKNILGYNIVVKGDSLNSIGTNQVIENIDGFVFLDDIAVQGSVDVKSIKAFETSHPNATEDDKEAAFAQYVTLKVKKYSTGNIIATISHVSGSEGLGFILTYEDGSTQTIESFFAQFSGSLDGLPFPIGGDDQVPAEPNARK